MKRMRMFFSVVLLLISAFVITGGRASGALAQDSNLVGHALVGTWLADTDTSDDSNPPSLFVFTSDGIYLQTDADGTAGYGVWKATSETTADLTAYFLSGDSEGNFYGMAIVRGSITLSADGMSFTAPFTLEIVDPTGATSGQAGPGEASGTKLSVETMGVPVGTMDELFGDDGGDGGDGGDQSGSGNEESQDGERRRTHILMCHRLIPA